MTVTGLETVILLAVGAVAVLTLTVLRWDLGRARRTKRALGLLGCQLLLLLTIGAAANRQLRWFSSWSDLVGAGGSLKHFGNSACSTGRTAGDGLPISQATERSSAGR